MSEKAKRIHETVAYDYIDKVYIDHLKERKIIINTEIDENIVENAVVNIMRWNSEDKNISIEERKPIIIYINSNGGSVSDGFSLIDTMINSKTPVYTVNIGSGYSMGCLIFLAGHKRYAHSFSTLLLHDGQSFLYNSMSKLRDTAKFYESLELKIKNFVLAHSNLTEEIYDKKYGCEWYMFPEEAKEIGFVDFIIGTDCDMEEVI